MSMKSIVRFVVTAVLVLIACVVVWNIWVYYEVAPRTRDGRIRADVVTVAADVAGRVVDVAVHDDQTVRKGDVLFRIDPARYRIAVQQVEGALEDARATMEQAKRDAARYDKLGVNIASVQQHEQAATAAAKAAAGYEEAKAALALAQLNLASTTVKAPVNGIVTDLSLQSGDYVAAGSPVVAMVDSDSFYAVGYFEETKLSGIKVGDPVKVTLMGERQPLYGHVTGIAAAITDPSRTTNAQLLPDVNPSFTWVRLAQRIPVRIALDHPPQSLRLVAGRTASVEVLSK